MSGVFYAIFGLAILIVIRWYVQNERNDPDADGSLGLLAMRQPDGGKIQDNSKQHGSIPGHQSSGEFGADRAYREK
jgi:hypothetical protein